MSSILAPRRIAIAIVLAVVLASASVLAVSVEQARPLGEVPATWGVAAPLVGDRGEYRYSVYGSDGRRIGEEVPYLGFEQLAPREEHDATGAPILVNRLAIAQGMYGGRLDGSRAWDIGLPSAFPIATDGRVPYLEVDSGELVGATEDRQVVPGVPLGFETSSAGSIRVRMYLPDDPLFSAIMAQMVGGSQCGLRNTLQGAERPMDEAFELVSDCRVAFGGVDTTDPTGGPEDILASLNSTLWAEFTAGVAKPLGVQSIGGVETLALRLRDVPASPLFPTVQVDVLPRVDSLVLWLAREVPYPVQYAIEHDGQVHILRLDSFARGTEPLATGPAQHAPAPSVAFTPMRPWGLDDAGSDLDVPASMAWPQLEADPDVAAFLDAHPLAFPFHVEADVRVDDYSGERTTTWTFQLTDGKAGLAVAVAASVRPVTAPPVLGLPVPSAGQLPPLFSVSSAAIDVFPPLDATWMPDSVPTGPSLVARWRTMAGAPDAAATWGYDVGCAAGLAGLGLDLEPDYASCANETLIALGYTAGFEVQPFVRLASTTSRMAVAGDPPTPRLDLVAQLRSASFDAAGTTLVMLDSVARARQEFDADPFVPGTATAPFEAPPRAGRDWAMPGVATVAGVGALAALVGLLYLLWPLAKGGVLGLYARVTGDAVLEHPVRQRLMAAVEAQPGIHLKQLSRQTGLAWGQTQHHVNKLLSAGLLVAKPSSSYTCYFPKGKADRHVMGAAAVLKAPGARRLLEVVAGTTGLSVGQIARAAGLTESTAHYHLKRLEQAGLVHSTLLDGVRQTTLTALGQQAGRAFGAPAAASA